MDLGLVQGPDFQWVLMVHILVPCLGPQMVTCLGHQVSVTFAQTHPLNRNRIDRLLFARHCCRHRGQLDVTIRKKLKRTSKSQFTRESGKSYLGNNLQNHWYLLIGSRFLSKVSWNFRTLSRRNEMENCFAVFRQLFLPENSKACLQIKTTVALSYPRSFLTYCIGETTTFAIFRFWAAYLLRRMHFLNCVCANNMQPLLYSFYNLRSLICRRVIGVSR